MMFFVRTLLRNIFYNIYKNKKIKFKKLQNKFMNFKTNVREKVH